MISNIKKPQQSFFIDTIDDPCEGGVSMFGGKDLFGGKNPFASR